MRITRTNWRKLIPFFTWPTFLNTCSYAFVAAMSEPPVSSVGIEVWTVVACTIALAIAKWFSVVRNYALVLLLNGSARSLEEAFAQAQSKKSLMLLVSAPLVLVNLFMLFTLPIGHWLVEQKEVVSGLVMFLLALISSLPDACLMLLTGAFLALYVDENLSLASSCGRFSFLLRQCLSYAFNFTSMFALLYYALSMWTIMLNCLDGIPKLFNGAARQILIIIITLFECIITTPIYAFIVALSAVAGLCLYRELRMRLEGSDLVEQANAL